MRQLVPALLGGLAIVGLLSVLCVVRARKLGALAPSIAEIGRGDGQGFPPEVNDVSASGFLWFETRRAESTSDTGVVFSSTG